MLINIDWLILIIFLNVEISKLRIAAMIQAYRNYFLFSVHENGKETEKKKNEEMIL